MKYLICLFFIFSLTHLVAQKTETFDIATYTVPSGWTQTNNTKNVVSYTITNNQKGTYCQIGVYASTGSKGNLQADFESEWQELVVKIYKPSTKPELIPMASENGWDAQAGVAPFEFNGARSASMLVTMSGNGRCMSIVIVTNTEDYQAEIEKFVDAVNLKAIAPASRTGADNAGQETTKQSSTPSAIKGAFTFSISNFDDGWTSTVQEDWVDVTKGGLKVLLHYPTSKIDVSSMDYKTISNNAWNTLVAPRYNSMNDFVLFGGSSDYEKPHFIAANVTDNKTGKKVYVALFKKGNSGWIEFITSDKNSFVQAFGLDIGNVDYYNTPSTVWDPLKKMADYNKFAVAASDLQGKWTNNFSGMTQYVNIYTGASAGASAHASTESFLFTGNTYHWELSFSSGMVGNLKANGAKSDGTLNIPNNWQIHFSNLEGKPKTYNAFFSCIKGGRMLWLEDTNYATGYTGYGKKE
jgi:hypothetical protein